MKFLDGLSDLLAGSVRYPHAFEGGVVQLKQLAIRQVLEERRVLVKSKFLQPVRQI